MICKSFRILLLAGLVISAVTAGGTVVAPGTTEARHHQPVPCEPDC